MFKISFIFVITLTTVLSSKLPENFLALGENYVYSAVPQDFFQSYAACKRNGWTLATEKNESATTILAQEIKANAAITTHYHWLGGFYLIEDEFQPRWIWLETGEYFNYTNWYGESQTTTASSQSVHDAMATYPGKVTTSSNLCLKKYDFSVNDGQWVTLDCETKLYFICEMS